MNLKIRQLEVFHALMEAGSVSRAADILNLTQPAVSVALSNLEAELGFQLFHRSRGYFAPTREAVALHAEAEQGLLAMARVERRAGEIQAGTAGSVSIASNGAAAINLLPWLIADFQRDYPGIQVDLKVRSSRQIAAWVSGGQVDIGLIDAPVPVAGVNVELFQLPCVCILREDDVLCAQSVIRPRMLVNRSIVAITGDHAIDRQLDRLMADANLSIERRVSSSFFAIARNFVRAGVGIALVDSINGVTDLSDGITWRPFAPRIDFELAMITPSGPPVEQSAQAFLSVLRANLAGKAGMESGAAQ